MKFIKIWLVPLLISVAIFAVVRPIMAQQIELPVTLNDFLQDNSVEVGSEVVDGFQQVYYIYEDQKFFVTDGNLNHRQSDSQGAYIAYVADIEEQGQVFLHHIPTDITTKLTNSGMNLRPKVSNDGGVVWEGWVEDTWQIFYFDGTKIMQVTQGDTAINPHIEGDFITFARRDLTGTWRAQVYSTLEDKTIDVRTGVGTKKPKLSKGEILLTDEETGVVESFALNVSDLFILELDPLVVEQTNINEDDILEELLELQNSSVEEVLESTPAGSSNNL